MRCPGCRPDTLRGMGNPDPLTAPRVSLRTCAGTFELGGRPWLMGIVNATPDSFSDAGVHRTLEDRVALAAELLAAGADVIDIGGESGVTNRPPVAAMEEIGRVVPLIERIAGELGALVSVDTYKAEVARAAVAAGAAIVNDVSGLRDPALADVCAKTGAGLVLMHTRAAPKEKLLDPAFDGRVVADVDAFLRERIALALGRGVAFEQLMLDPGPDFGKTPAQTVEVLPRAADAARARAAGAAGGLAQGLHRCDHRPPAAGSGWPGRWPRSGTASTPAPTSCACTTSPRWPTSWPCSAALAGEAGLDSGLRLTEDLRREPRRATPR